MSPVSPNLSRGGSREATKISPWKSTHGSSSSSGETPRHGREGYPSLIHLSAGCCGNCGADRQTVSGAPKHPWPLDGFERRILRLPHRLLDLLYWVVQL